MLENLIREYLIDRAGVDPEKFSRPDLRVADLELDSLGLLEMLFEVEDKFDLQIPEPMRFLSMSYAEMVADIEATVNQRPNPKIPASESTATGA
jgi:acyl carrier protein